MWMSEFVMKLNDFKDIYRIFGVKITIILIKKNCYDLIITVGFCFEPLDQTSDLKSIVG